MPKERLAKSLTLHEAMISVLREHGGWVARDELARQIAERDLYRQRVGTPAPSDQLRLRARKYPHLFQGNDAAFTRIRLRSEADVELSASPAPARGRRRGVLVSASHHARTAGASQLAPSEDNGIAARRRRARAARKYKPTRTQLLLVAEAPPSALDRYFYFEDVPVHDSLFRYVARAILGVDPTRWEKPRLLTRLRDRGVFLIDLRVDPLDGAPLAEAVPGLVDRARKLAPEKVILIKATVYDAAFASLRDAALPVVDERVPFPGSGQQRRFAEAFTRALAR